MGSVRWQRRRLRFRALPARSIRPAPCLAICPATAPPTTASHRSPYGLLFSSTAILLSPKMLTTRSGCRPVEVGHDGGQDPLPDREGGEVVQARKPDLPQPRNPVREP